MSLPCAQGIEVLLCANEVPRMQRAHQNLRLEACSVRKLLENVCIYKSLRFPWKTNGATPALFPPNSPPPSYVVNAENILMLRCMECDSPSTRFVRVAAEGEARAALQQAVLQQGREECRAELSGAIDRYE